MTDNFLNNSFEKFSLLWVCTLNGVAGGRMAAET